jgi:hypothetical protein
VDETLHKKSVFYPKNPVKPTYGNLEFQIFSGKDPGGRTPLKGDRRLKGRRK